MSSRVPACESVVNSIWRRMQQAWTVTAFRESRGASRRFRSAERGNATSSGLLIERVGSVAPAQLSVKARPVKSTLPALRSREGTRAPARLRSGLRHRSAVARERLALAQGVAASHGCETGWDVHVDSLKSVPSVRLEDPISVPRMSVPHPTPDGHSFPLWFPTERHLAAPIVTFSMSGSFQVVLSKNDLSGP